jgi:cellulose synthase/poly-beta-1,6-N-acetylglucosamine synthase-like glycosyltransferase
VDVLVSALNEEAYLARCLDAVLDQDYPRELLRVIFIDGGSTDGTIDIARRRAADDPRLTVIADHGRLNLPEALNLGLAVSSGDLVAKIDGHGYPEPDFVYRAATILAAEGDDVAAVGGRPEQEGETVWGDAVATARASRFGTGGSVYAGTSSREYVDTVQCGIYRRDALEAVGRFDATMVYGEDDELNWRLRESGYRILLDTSVRFHYVARATLPGVYRQYRNYGRAKVRVASAHPRYVKPWHVAPAALVLALGTAVALTPFSRRSRRAAKALVASYATVAMASAVWSRGAKDVRSRTRVGACFAAMHLGYGTGMLAGLAAAIRRRI